MFGQLNRKKEGHSQVEIRECFWYNWKHKIHHLGEEIKVFKDEKYHMEEYGDSDTYFRSIGLSDNEINALWEKL